MTTTIDNSPPRRGRTAHQLTVTQVQRPVPRVVSITVRGESLAAFTPPNPGGHIKIAFDSRDGEGALLHVAVQDLPAALGADWFIATEAAAMRRIRNHLRSDRQIAPDRLQTRGYWRHGEPNYPDHAYGDD